MRTRGTPGGAGAEIIRSTVRRPAISEASLRNSGKLSPSSGALIARTASSSSTKTRHACRSRWANEDSGRRRERKSTTVPVEFSSSSKNCSNLSNSAVSGELLRSEEHTSELQSPCNLVCRLLLEKKKKQEKKHTTPGTSASHRHMS